MEHRSLLDTLQRLIGTGDIHAALRLSERGVSELQDDARYHSLMGQLYARQGRLDSAETHFRRAVELRPSDPATWLNLGLFLEKRQDRDGAEAAYRQALKLAPDHPGAHNYLGDLLRLHNQPRQALVHLQRAHELAPHDPGILNNLALVHQALDELEAAEKALRTALALQPRHIHALSNLGALLKKQERHEEALEVLRRALAIQPDFPSAINNMAEVLRHLGRPDEALPLLRSLVRHHPQRWEYHLNLCLALRDTGAITTAMRLFNEALKFVPKSGKPHLLWARSSFHLLLNNFARGWADYEWGVAVGDRSPRTILAPPWEGDPVPGKLLVLAEQGIGDQIMFATCLPDALERAGPDAEVMVECDARLAPLFRRSFPRCRILERAKGEVDWEAELGEPVRAQIPIGSLPRLFRNQPEDFPRQQRLLQADPERIEFWRRCFQTLGPGKVIGLSWRAGGVDASNRNLELAQLAPILCIPGVHWVDMQYWASEEERREAEQLLGVRLHRWPQCDPFHDLNELAAQMAACDGMLTIANTNAHLAGALGVPSLVLLPFVPSWRWGMSGETTPWYASLRLLRQPRLRDWDSVIAHLNERFPAWLDTLGR